MKRASTTPKNRVAVITGAVEGIGRNIARAFAKEGMTVIIGDINEIKGKETEHAFRKEGLKVFFQHVDLAEIGAPQRFISEVVKNWGRIDTLVNNVRAGQKTSFETENEGNWDLTLNVMLRASFFASREAMFIMKQQGEGSIVNMGSILGSLANSESPAYQIAKAGLSQMTRYLALEGGKYGVRVNTVSPGIIIEDENKKRFESLENESYKALAEGSVMTPEVGSSNDIAQMVVFLSDPRNKFITGQEFIVDGGASVKEHFDLIMSMKPQQVQETHKNAAA